MIGDPITLIHPKKPGWLIFIDGIREADMCRGKARFRLFFLIETVKWDPKEEANMLKKSEKIHAVAFSQWWFDTTQDGWRITKP